MADDKFVSQENAATIAAILDKRLKNRLTDKDLASIKSDLEDLWMLREQDHQDLTETQSFLNDLQTSVSGIESKLERSALISTIGVFGKPTATRAGTVGLVPAPPAKG